MGNCSSVQGPTPAVVARRTKDLQVLKAWRAHLESLTKKEREQKVVKGHPECSAVCFTVYHASGLDESFRCLSDIDVNDTDWMVCITRCGGTLSLSSLQTGPWVEGHHARKNKPVNFVHNLDIKHNFDNLDLFRGMKASDISGLEMIEFYHNDFLPLVYDKPDLVPKDHWSKKQRWCGACKDANETLTGEEQELAENGLLADPYTSPVAEYLVPFDEKPGHHHHHHHHDHHLHTHDSEPARAHTPVPRLPSENGVNGPTLLDPAQVILLHRHLLPHSQSQPGSRNGSVKGSRHHSGGHHGGGGGGGGNAHLLPLPISTAPSRSRSPSPSPRNSPDRSPSPSISRNSQSRSRSRRSKPVAKEEKGGMYLQTLQPRTPGQSNRSLNQLPLLAPEPVHAAMPSVGSGMIVSATGEILSTSGEIQLVMGNSRPQSRRPSIAKHSTQWHEGTYHITHFGCDQLQQVGISARVVDAEGVSTPQGHFIRIDNHSHHSITFSARQIGEHTMAAGQHHSFKIDHGEEKKSPGQEQADHTVELKLTYGVDGH